MTLTSLDWATEKVSSLESFIHFVDAEFDFTSFSDVLLLCARDVVTGIDYLHQKNIAHSDLKAGNTLVSNQHYSSKDGDWAELYTRNALLSANLQILA